MSPRHHRQAFQSRCFCLATRSANSGPSESPKECPSTARPGPRSPRPYGASVWTSMRSPTESSPLDPCGIASGLGEVELQVGGALILELPRDRSFELAAFDEIGIDHH